MSAPEPLVAHRDNPYFGLEFYDEQYGAWFFGRETESDKVAANLQAARLTVLHAESGVGKSSLLRAGVAWRMGRLAEDRVARHRPVRFVPVVFSYWKGDPVADLAGAIGTAIEPYLGERPPPRLPTDQLDAAIEETSGALNTSLLIMLDQFEEYFLYRSREPVPERFADQLARCVTRTDLRANFLIALREDAYAGLGDLFKGRIANVYGNYLHIDYLDRTSAEQAIREPLAVYNAQRDVTDQVTLQPDLVQTVLNELLIRDDSGASNGHAPAVSNGGGRVSTPLLQLVMEQIWDAERAEGSHELRLATLQKLRGVRMIADTHLTNALDSLGGTDREIALDMFDHLVTPTGGKIAESVPDLARRTGHSEAEVGGVLAKLDGERIVRSVPAAPGQQDPLRFRRYEIFHDVLAAPINRAIGAQEERRRTRRIRRFAALAIALLLVVTGVAVAFAVLAKSANDATQAANKEKLTAESRQLAAEAAQNVGQDPALSTQLALQALQLDQTNEAQQALRAALPGIQAVGTISDGSVVYSTAFDPGKSDWVASADGSGIARMWDVKTGKTLFTMSLGGFSKTGSADAVAFNPSGSEVAVGFANGNVAVFDAGTGKEIGLPANDGYAIIYGVGFLGNTGEIVIASQQNTVLWQYTKGTQCCEVLSSEPATAVATTPAKPQELAVATQAGLSIIDVSGQKPRSRQLTSTPATTVSFNHAGSEVVSAETGGDVAIYDVPAGDTVARLVGDSVPETAAFSRDGTRVVAGYANGTALIWDRATALPLTVLNGNADAINMVQFSTDGSQVVTAGADGTIRVWYAQPRELRTEFASPAGGLLYGADYIGGRILDLEQDHEAYMFTPGGALLANITPHAVAADTADWDRSGSKIVVAGADGNVQVLKATGATYTPVQLATPINTGPYTGGVAMTPDGSRIGIVTNGGYTVQVRDADTGTVQQTLIPKNAIEAIGINEGGRIVGADYHGQVELWTGGNAHPRMLGTPGATLTNIAFSRSGSKFATVSAAGVVTVWDTNGARAIQSIKNACPAPSAAAFNPSESMIVVSCGDGTVRVFDVASGQSLVVLQATTAGAVAFADFSPDGNSIIASVNATNIGFIQIWNAELATSSLPKLEQIARQRVTQQLTPAQRQEYMPGF
jgi:WD40 repeat protein